ncbi:hypothetical protein QGP82_14535 [Leptothoe sp. LEGE 181152]|uniref:Uncharacterized protein n=1 Tax=Adonisia turfae CCMR0081 TaxID=2292702 RepID=A0A6M0RR84_9CYAN|nr:hypothetical protein [Adonisia turfae]MDV3349919.1 hypothetical protein [Leptothoe sp. LEGE 181152]NEZ58767.1 hypothetical protein [Adonisia turfae CCMR0081]
MNRKVAKGAVLAVSAISLCVGGFMFYLKGAYERELESDWLARNTRDLTDQDEKTQNVLTNVMGISLAVSGVTAFLGFRLDSQPDKSDKILE